MKNSIAILLISLLATACSSSKNKSSFNTESQKPAVEAEVKNTRDCESIKEYVTTIEYLRLQKDLAVPDTEARKISKHVAQGCTGAANRFIKISQILLKSYLPGKVAFESAMKLALKSDKEVGAFIESFRHAFLEEYLDMDVNNSIKLAHSLSSEFDGDSSVAVQDFKDVAEFCIKTEELKYDKAECGQMGALVARLGQNSKSSVAESFKDTYSFIHSEKGGPNLSISDSIRITEELIEISPKAAQNYIEAYKYATNTTGLGLAAKDALQFAREMAAYTSNRTTSAVMKSK